MVKVLIDNIVLNGAETIFFSVVGEDGPCGNFKLIERNPEKFGKHKVGEEFQLVVKPVFVPEVSTEDNTDLQEKKEEKKVEPEKKPKVDKNK